ncbi:hypothetical protein [Bartonella quintana]|uniref:hypothetical protein n=1 Tax=Bartonella quintana TaxID=803 RepID=UPI0011AB40D7|nr:hypothetical protein [Bartonella quintana]
MEDLEKTKNISKSGGNYGNYPQKQKSVGECISDSILDIEFRITLKHIHAMIASGFPLVFKAGSVLTKAGRDCFTGL